MGPCYPPQVAGPVAETQNGFKLYRDGSGGLLGLEPNPASAPTVSKSRVKSRRSASCLRPIEKSRSNQNPGAKIKN